MEYKYQNHDHNYYSKTFTIYKWEHMYVCIFGLPVGTEMYQFSLDTTPPSFVHQLMIIYAHYEVYPRTQNGGHTQRRLSCFCRVCYVRLRQHQWQIDNLGTRSSEMISVRLPSIGFSRIEKNNDEIKLEIL